MKYKNIIYRKRGRIAQIVLNRPEKHNAFSNDLVEELHRALDEAESNDRVKVLILSGAGPSFCSGHDLSQVGFQYGWKEPKPGEKAKPPSQRARLSFDRLNISERLRRIFLFPKVTIAQVHGYCIAEGFYTVSLCDLSIASNDAKFARLEQRMGFGGSGPDFPILAMTIGLKRAMEILLTGRYLSGEEAAAIGLVNKAVPRNELEEEVESLAQQISLLSADGIAIAKAERQMHYEAMGLTSGFSHTYVTHTLATNMKLDPDEFNFFRERRDRGVAEAIHKRNGLFKKKSED